MAPGNGGGLPRPRKRFGQHFLNDPRVLDRIADALAPEPGDTVIEIGPGRGSLTARLAPRCARLIAVEIDRDLVTHLREAMAATSSVEVVEGDALEVDWAALARGPYRLAGNLPYYITTPLIFRILESPRPTRAVLMVQREVGERLSAAPGSANYGALSINVQVTAAVQAVGRVPPGAFHPRPRVESAIVRLDPLADPLVAPWEEEPFRRFVQAAFGMRRKQLLRIVRALWVPHASDAMAVLADLDLAPDARPEVLSPADFVRLFRRTREGSGPNGEG